MTNSLRKIVLVELFFPLALLTLGIYHGLLQGLYRAGILVQSSFGGLEYYQGLTAHGVINGLVLTTFFAVAFGHVIIEQFLAKPVVFRLALVGAVSMVAGALISLAAILSGRASVLYTFYPPLKAHPAFYIGLALLIIGSWLSFYSWIPAYRQWRRENGTAKPPLAAMAIITTFIIWQIATLPVVFEVVVMLLPWSFGLVDGVNVVLARTLFWFFGHALVYFWLLPAYLMFYVVLPKVCGGKMFSDGAARFVFLMFMVFSAPLGLHHQFSDPGIASKWKALHTVATSFVAIPSMITAFSVAASLEYSAKRAGGHGLFAWWLKLPYFTPSRWLFPYLFCGLVIFIFGGLTGVINGSYNMSLVVHNTAWIPAHFHMTVGGPVILAILGMSLFMISGLLGRTVRCPKLALSVPYLWTVGLLVFSGGQFLAGLWGQPRRTNLGLTYLNPDSTMYRSDWAVANMWSAFGAVVMTVSIVVFFVVLALTLFQPSSKQVKEEFAIPSSDALHDEQIGWLRNLRPWIYAAVIAILISYVPPLLQIYQDNYQPAPGFHSDSPVQVK